jgi:MYXO-CTERM domain-containing protein
MSRATCLALFLTTALAGPARAATFYVDPQNGSDSGSGSKASPFKTLQTVVDSVAKAGDTILLLSGYYGLLTINGRQNTQHVTIAAAPGAKARFPRVLVRDSSYWTLRGLDVSPSYAPTYSKQTMIELQSYNQKGPLEEIVVEDCVLRSVPDVSGWSDSDWNNKAASGIGVGGTKMTIRNNKVENVNFGISVGATHSLIKGNLVKNFSGDGMRGLGDHTVFEGNTVKNCYDVNANHDDGFQSWTKGSDGKVGTGQVVGVVLRGNLIINYEDPKQPYRGTLQGIGMFDGTFVDWVIENNVIITDHWHGITLMGAKNCRVVNNTVIDLNTTSPGPPWIRVTNHKDGTPPSGCLVRNNLATAFTSASTGVTEDHNIKVTSYADHFVDAAGHDLRLIATSAAIDSGSSQNAPVVDFDGVARPQGKAIDVGAFEWHKGPLPDAAAPKPDSGGSPAPDGAPAASSDSGAGPAADGAPILGGDSGSSASPDSGPQAGSDGASPAADSGCVDCADDDSLSAGCAVAPGSDSAGSSVILMLLVIGLAQARRR